MSSIGPYAPTACPRCGYAALPRDELCMGCGLRLRDRTPPPGNGARAASALVVAVVAVVVVVVGVVVWHFTTGGSHHGYSVQIETNFRNGCEVTSGGRTDYCRCMLDRLEQRYTESQLLDLEDRYRTTGSIPNELVQEATHCL